MIDRKSPLVASLVLSAMVACSLNGAEPNESAASSTGERMSFNGGWNFHLGDAVGAEVAAYDHSGWRSLDLPHDWAIEGPFDVKYNARCGGLPFHGTGWYRKTFQVPTDAQGKVVSITFDGAMYNAHVWVNGHFVGNRPCGYIEFQCDISKYLQYGVSNVISDQRDAFNGLCMLIVKAGKQAGTIRIKAESDGLQSGSASLTVR